jgi:hypothetical protein
MGVKCHCCTLQQSLQKSTKKIERGLEPAFLRILSPPRFLHDAYLLTCGMTVPFLTRTLSTFHGARRPRRGKQVRLRQAEAGGGRRQSGPEQQRPSSRHRRGQAIQTWPATRLAKVVRVHESRSAFGSHQFRRRWKVGDGIRKRVFGVVEEMGRRRDFSGAVESGSPLKTWCFLGAMKWWIPRLLLAFWEYRKGISWREPKATYSGCFMRGFMILITLLYFDDDISLYLWRKRWNQFYGG